MKKILLNTEDFSTKKAKEIKSGFLWGILQGVSAIGLLVFAALDSDKSGKNQTSRAPKKD